MVAIITALIVSLLAIAVVATPITNDDAQLPLSSLLSSSLGGEHTIHPSILTALERYPDDPVDALLAVKPDLAEMMGEPRLLRIFGEEPREAIWMTEGDKLRLRREGKKFMDLTKSRDLLSEYLIAGQARKPRCFPLTTFKLTDPRHPQHHTPTLHPSDLPRSLHLKHALHSPRRHIILQPLLLC